MRPNVAIIGTGWDTNIQVPIFRQAGWTVTALSSRLEDKARKSHDESCWLELT